jgi:outer membrane receptor protein involved in Fe transport
MKTHPSRIALAGAFTLGLTAALTAQTAPPLDQETVLLSPFIVDTTTDRGYIAVDSLAGGRTNTPIKLTPAAMSSITRTFIDDVRITNVREALRWTPNVVPTDPNAGRGFGGAAFHDWSFNYRSAGAGQQGGPGPTRNYFAFYQNADSYNIERLEIVRGPNSLLFGLGTVGGTLSTYTKVPRLDDTFVKPTLTLDNHGTIRFEGDINVVANNQLAVRINALYDDNEGWRDGDNRELKAGTLAFLYKLTDHTTFRAEAEVAQRRGTLISSTIGDKTSGWDGQTHSPTWGAAPVGSARTTRIQNAGAWGDWLSAFWVYVPSLPANQAFQPWAGGYASTNSLADVGQALPFAPYAGYYPSEIKLPWESTYSSTANIPVRPGREWTYGHGISEVDYDNVTVFLDHRFSENFDISLSAYRYSDEYLAKDYEGTGGAAIDINRQLPDGSANPNFGKPFADFFLSKQTQGRTNTEARALVNYKFDAELFGQPWRQRFSASTGWRKLEISARQYLAQVVSGGLNLPNKGDWPQNMVWGRLYLDQPNQIMSIPSTIAGKTIEYRGSPFYWFDFDDEFRVNDYSFVSHSRLFNDSLSIIAGVRRDEYDEDLRSLRRGPGETDQFTKESDGGTTYSAGAVYYFNWLGVFANYSENIQPPNAGSQPLLNGNRPGPENGESLEYGLRVSTGDGKYYASLLRYDSKSIGHLVENPIGLRGIWERYNERQGRPVTDGFGSLAYSDTTSRDISGYEFELTANPTESLRLQASYGKPKAEVVDFYPGARAHVAQYLPTWAPVAAGDTTLQNRILEVQNRLTQATAGAPQQGSIDYTASIFANYSFLGDFLRGFSIGAGASRIGQTYAGTYSGDNYYGDSVTYTHAVLAYETRFGRVGARFAVNIENILDDDDPIVTGYHWGFVDRQGRQLREGYYYQDARTIRVTAQFTF